VNFIEALKTGKAIRNKRFPRHSEFFRITQKFFDFNKEEILDDDWEVEPEPKKKVARWLWLHVKNRYCTDYFFTEAEARVHGHDWKKLEWSETIFDE
jgi:hypothetical protein